jgi:hypothetical protein
VTKIASGLAGGALFGLGSWFLYRHLVHADVLSVGFILTSCVMILAGVVLLSARWP